jgi:hypothetical protein
MNNHERAELDWFGQAREGPGGSHVGTIGIWVVKTYLVGLWAMLLYLVTELRWRARLSTP